MSTYSPDLRIELITTGDQSGVWGTTTNTNLGTIIEDAISGYVTVSVTSANQAFTALNGVADEARNAMIRLTTTTTAAFAVYAPPSSKQYIVWNNSGYAATIYNSTVLGNTTAAGTGVTIADGDKVVVFSNGTNFYTVKSSGVTGTVAVANGGTGQTSYTDGQLLIGNTTGNTLVKSTLTAGTNISITNGSGSITVASTAPTTSGTSILYGNGSGGFSNVTVGSGLSFSTGTLSSTAPTTSGTSILYGNGSGGFSNVTVGSGLSFAGGTLSTSGGGTVTSVGATSPVTSSGGTAPTIALDLAYGDTQNPYASKTANYILAAPNGSAGTPSFRALVAADIPSLSYAPQTSGTSILYGNGSGGFSNVTVGSGLSFSTGTLSSTAPTTSGTSILYGNGSGGFSNVTIGSNLTFAGGTLSASGGGTPASPSTSVQFNNSGSFGGSYYLTYQDSLDSEFVIFTVGNIDISNRKQGSNVAVGYQAMLSNANGGGCVAVGYQALKANVNNYYNTAIGSSALTACSSGAGNVAVGCNAGIAITSGSSNIAIGSGATGTLEANLTGNYNIAVGAGALKSATSSNNTGVGHTALTNLTSGTDVLALGYQAGKTISTGTNCTYIGSGTTASSSSVTYELVLSVWGAIGKGANTGFISTGPSAAGVYQGNNSASWSTTSDRRLKKNIVDNTDGLNKIMQVQVRNFEYRTPEEVDPELQPTDAVLKSGVQLGVIAQEFQQVLPECVRQESTGVLAVDPDNLTWYLVNAVKQLKAELDVARAEIAALKG